MAWVNSFPLVSRVCQGKLLTQATIVALTGLRNTNVQSEKCILCAFRSMARPHQRQRSPLLKKPDPPANLRQSHKKSSSQAVRLMILLVRYLKDQRLLLVVHVALDHCLHRAFVWPLKLYTVLSVIYNAIIPLHYCS